MTKLQKILTRLYGYNIDEAEKEILKWHNSKQLSEYRLKKIIEDNDVHKSRFTIEHSNGKDEIWYQVDVNKLAHSIKEAMDKK